MCEKVQFETKFSFYMQLKKYNVLSLKCIIGIVWNRIEWKYEQKLVLQDCSIIICEAAKN